MEKITSSVRRFISLFAISFLALTTLIACGGTDNDINEWWYNQTYEAPAQ